jgi:hypothetical protein
MVNKEACTALKLVIAETKSSNCYQLLRKKLSGMR